MHGTEILIADRHHVVIEGVRSLLGNYPGLRVVGETTTAVETLAAVKLMQPSITIVDPALASSMTETGFISEIKRAYFNTIVIAFTAQLSRIDILRFSNAGMRAYVSKTGPLSELIEAIFAVRQGAYYFNGSIVDATHDGISYIEAEYEQLSHREQTVFRLLAEGKTIKDIAYQLVISPKTVESHKYSIMRKLDAENLAHLTQIAVRKNIISIE